MRQLQRFARRLIDVLVRRLDLGRRHLEADFAQIEIVELPRELDQCRVTLGAYARDDGGDRRVHVGRLLAFQPEQQLEAVLEIWISGLEPRGHGKRVQEPGSVPGCSGFERVLQAGPRSLSSASMHSTWSWIEASPEKVRMTLPAGASSGSKRTASSDSTLSSALGLTCLSLAPNTRSNLERRPPPLEVLAVAALRRLPVEAVEHGGEALLRRLINHVADAHHRILEMRRDDGEVLLIEGDQFERLHGGRGGQLVTT